MVDIQSVISNVQSGPSGRATTDASDFRRSSQNDVYAPDRIIHDTIDISDEGDKIINLSRHADLTKSLPDARTNRAEFDAAISRALEDINRITTLFGAVSSQLAGHQIGAGAGQQRATEQADTGADGTGNYRLQPSEGVSRSTTSVRDITSALTDAFRTLFSKT